MRITGKHGRLAAGLVAALILAAPMVAMPATAAPGANLAVNSGFDVPQWSTAKEGQGLPWVYVDAAKGKVRSYYQAMNGSGFTMIAGLDAASFAWTDVTGDQNTTGFELHHEKDGNTAADVHAGRTVAQTFDTTPGAVYTVSIRHSGRSKGNAGGVTLLVGPDRGHLTPISLKRTSLSETGRKYGDTLGDVGTVAYTHSDSTDAIEGTHAPWDHSKDWETYEGQTVIPAGQTRTMFAYRGVDKAGQTIPTAANDSVIDDLSFQAAYPLAYNTNGAQSGVTPRQKE